MMPKTDYEGPYLIKKGNYDLIMRDSNHDSRVDFSPIPYTLDQSGPSGEQQ